MKGFSLKLTISRGKVASDLNNFPVYVNLADLPIEFFNRVRTDGGDIRILKEDITTEVPLEVVAIDTTAKTGELYFKADLLSTKDNVFYICFGDASRTAYARTAAYGSDNVWGANAMAVYHTRENLNDSSSNERNLTDYNSPSYVDGKIGKALSLNGSNQYARFNGTNPILPSMSPSTLSCWVKIIDGGTGNNVMLKAYGSTDGGRSGTLLARKAGKGGYLIVHKGTPNINYEAYTPENMSVGTWYYLVGTYDVATGTIKTYQNAVVGTLVINPFFDTPTGTARFQIGTEQDTATPSYFKGEVCSMKIWNYVRSQTEILAEYTNQSDPATFYSIEGVTPFINTNFLGAGQSNYQKDVYFKRNLDTVKKKRNEVDRLKSELLKRLI